jgi:hypothetical protein
MVLQLTHGRPGFVLEAGHPLCRQAYREIEADSARGPAARDFKAPDSAATEAEIPRLKKPRAFARKRRLAIPRPAASGV